MTIGDGLIVRQVPAPMSKAAPSATGESERGAQPARGVQVSIEPPTTTISFPVQADEARERADSGGSGRRVQPGLSASVPSPAATSTSTGCNHEPRHLGLCGVVVLALLGAAVVPALLGRDDGGAAISGPDDWMLTAPGGRRRRDQWAERCCGWDLLRPCLLRGEDPIPVRPIHPPTSPEMQTDGGASARLYESTDFLVII